MELKNTFAANQVRMIETTLTDGSKVYDVELIDSDAKVSMIINCTDESDARDVIDDITIMGLCDEIEMLHERH